MSKLSDIIWMAVIWVGSVISIIGGLYLADVTSKPKTSSYIISTLAVDNANTFYGDYEIEMNKFDINLIRNYICEKSGISNVTITNIYKIS